MADADARPARERAKNAEMNAAGNAAGNAEGNAAVDTEADPPTAARPGRPVFGPRGSLGWKLGPLDGLSCYLRCVEAVLRARGYSPPDVAHALLQPLDLLRASTTSSAFAHCRVDWTVDRPAAEAWPAIERLLEREPVLVSPDSYEWPSHEFYRRKHQHDHVVVIAEARGDDVIVLDTDAPAADGYARTLPRSVVGAAATRYGVVRAGDAPPRHDAEAAFREFVAPHLVRLEGAAESLFAFERRWREAALPDGMARAVHVIALGDAQPQFLTLEVALAGAARPELRAAGARAADARRAALRLGLELRIEHNDTSAGYLRSKAALRELGRALVSFAAASRDAAGALGAAAGGEPSPPDAFFRRAAALAGWCFGEPPAGAEG